MPRRSNSNQRIKRAPGKVDMHAARPPTRLRTLVNIESGETIEIYGYAGHPPCDGPWFGYLVSELTEAPCKHCGQTGVFQPGNWGHVCPGYWDMRSKDKVKLECEPGHTCEGAPSMSFHGAGQWSFKEWEERE